MWKHLRKEIKENEKEKRLKGKWTESDEMTEEFLKSNQIDNETL